MTKASPRKKMQVALTKDRLATLTAKPWYLPDLDAATFNGKALPKSELVFTGKPDGILFEGLLPKSLFLIGTGKENDFYNINGIVLGGNGNDTFSITTSDTTVAGGQGADVFYVTFERNARLMTGVILDLQKNDILSVSFVDGFGSTFTQTDVNDVIAKYKDLCNLKLSFFVSKNFTGTNKDDIIAVYDGSDGLVINGGKGNDFIEGLSDCAEDLQGGDGNDTLKGNGGYDRLFGGAGADTIYVKQGDTIVGSEDLDTIIVASTGVNTKGIKGKIRYEVIVQDDNVSFSGGDFEDYLAATGKGVTLVGGGGKDYFEVNDRNDEIADLERGEVVEIYSDAAALMAKAKAWQNKGAIVRFNIQNEKPITELTMLNGDDYFRALATVKIHGGGGHDTIQGDTGKDTLYGDAGNDVLIGYDDADVLKGGDGNDELHGEDGNDVLQGDAGHDMLNGQNGADSLTGEAGNDTLNGGDGKDTLRGGEGTDLLIGGDGDDTMIGGTGSDTLVAGNGNDVLTGDDAPGTAVPGARGKDVFVFNVTNEAYLATITDFTSGEDKIDLSGFTMAGFSAAQISNAVTFSKGMLTADFNNDGFLDLNVKLQPSARFNKATDLVVNSL